MSDSPRKRFPCPCCGYLTLGSEPPGTYELCEVCFWEDDQVQFRDPEYRGGANEQSLREAREGYRRLGAIDEGSLAFVREPRPPVWTYTPVAGPIVQQAYEVSLTP